MADLPIAAAPADAERLDELEIRFTLQQDLLHQLSDVVAQHARQIDDLKKEVERLRKRDTAEPQSLDPDERPPHY